ncbi:MAG TPA: cyanophycin synthetase [Solirubrobacteraceae bacterium]|nr:cyanophycin synthetase [Solirubrobacteraceae bacterium]
MNRQERPTPAGAFARQQRAEGQLRSLELFGMRFGLDRMRRMMTALGSPERSFEAVHVLGTNGKSSTTRMTAAILERHGLRTGCYLSPHLVSYCERVLVGERDMDPDGFADAVSRAVWAAERVNRTLAGDDHVTQFELLTAAAFWHMAAAGVEVAVVEAGLGGRYDATSVLDAPVTVLTNVGLEHTRWLGPTVRDIAEEKLAAVAPGAVLVLGEELDEQADAVARRVGLERGARIVRARPPEPALALRANGEFQRHNFALARAAAGAYLQRAGIPEREPAVTAAAAATEVQGRLQVLAEDPLTILDGAHNPHAVASLLGSLPALVGERPLGLVLGVLDDKDAAAMLQELLARARRAWFVAPPSPRALPPATLGSLARQLGFTAAESGPGTARALREAQPWAREHGGAVLVTGSVYLVGEVLAQGSAR